MNVAASSEGYPPPPTRALPKYEAESSAVPVVKFVPASMLPDVFNNILTYNVAATQELDTTVTALLAEIASLKERLSALEN